MGHPQSVWKHKKYKNREYVGTYHYDFPRRKKSSREREFILTAILRNGKKHRIPFESHEAAYEAGWRKKK